MEILRIIKGDRKYFNEDPAAIELKRFAVKVLFAILHIAFVYGLFLLLKNQIGLGTFIWTVLMFAFGGIGTGVSAHIYFTHRSFKATRAFKIFLIFCQTVSGQQSLNYWVKTHRIHHKFTDTDKDPTNIKEGFMFSYIGYNYLPRHPDCQMEWDRMDISDLETDKDVMLQYKYYAILYALFAIGLPTLIPVYYWNESLWIACWMNLFRYSINVSHVNFANTIAHLYGSRPYERNVSATENDFMFIWAFGEGYHNYHHAFPMDYRSIHHNGLVTFLIELWEKWGWIYDLKVSTPDTVASRIRRTGDGSYHHPTKAT